MFELVSFFTQSVRQLTSLADLQTSLDAITKDLGFNYFALLEHVDLSSRADGRILALSTYPEAWVETYIARGLVSRDPILLASHRTGLGFRWSAVGEFVDITSAHRRIRDETRRAGIMDGFTVPAHVPGRFHGSCNFAADVERDLVPEAYHAAQLIGAFAFEAGRTILQRDQRIPPKIKLSQRMLDCALMVALGKTDWETGTILGIAEDTVSEYLDEARRRYDVVSRTQLIMHVLFDGHLAISDVVR